MMNRPERYQITTDYTSLKNEREVSLSLTLAAEYVVDRNTTRTLATASVSPGSTSSLFMSAISYGGNTYMTPLVSITTNVIMDGGDVTDYILVSVRRSGASVQLVAEFNNPSSEVVVITPGVMTISARVLTFLTIF